jgi:hypothetical protein
MRVSRGHAGLAAAGLVAVLFGAPAAAEAHMRSVTFSDIAVEGRDVVWTLRVRARDLGGPEVGLGLPAGDDLGPVLARQDAVARYLASKLLVEADGAPCALARGAVQPAEGADEPTARARLVFACPRVPGMLALGYRLLYDVDPFHAGYATIAGAGPSGAPVTHLFRRGDPPFAFDVARGPWSSAGAYLRLGIEHIFTGYDHLAFLAALLLATGLKRGAGARAAVPSGRREALREVLKIVTAFTVAHSITLILSTLRPGLIPTAWVEPAIALSIAYVAVENVVAPARRRRWLVAFGFGLVHGLGFSSVLREVGLPPRGLVLSLLAFNVGVEIGQLVTVAVVLPLVLLGARRRPLEFRRWALRGGSTALAVAGMVWFFLRIRS